MLKDKANNRAPSKAKLVESGKIYSWLSRMRLAKRQKVQRVAEPMKVVIARGRSARL